MNYNPAIHHRQSIRLKGYDYSSAGAYFITAVLQHRRHLFGRVCEGGMQLSEAGKIAQRCWEEIPDHFPLTAVDEFVIMPDHMHGIVIILREKPRGGVQLNAASKASLSIPLNDERLQLNAASKASLSIPLNDERLQLNAASKASLSAPLNDERFPLNAPSKTSHTRKDNYFSIISPRKKTLSVIIRTYKAAVTTICRENGIYEFQWQRNYHERIIRDEGGLAAVRRYILNNPAKWLRDKKNNDAF